MQPDVLYFRINANTISWDIYPNVAAKGLNYLPDVTRYILSRKNKANPPRLSRRFYK